MLIHLLRRNLIGVCCFDPGKSGSGKTTAVNRLATAAGKPKYVVNQSEPDPNFIPVTWAKVPALSHATLLVEDLVNVPASQLPVLQKLLTFQARHQSVDVYLICHAVAKNGVFTLVQHCTQVNFTLSKSNVGSLVLVADHFKVGKQEKDRWVQLFLAASGQYGFFVLDVEARTFARGDSGAESGGAEASRAALAAVSPRKTLEEYAGFLCQPDRALKIFDFIVSEIPSASLDPRTLLLTLKTKRTGALVRVSLLDYLHALDSDEPPGGDIIRLHYYLIRRVSIPRVFVRNPHLRGLEP